MRPQEITTEIRSIVTGVRLDARVAEPGIGEMIEPLTRALDLAADLLDAQQKFLVGLRNHKADAS